MKKFFRQLRFILSSYSSIPIIVYLSNYRITIVKKISPVYSTIIKENNENPIIKTKFKKRSR